MAGVARRRFRGRRVAGAHRRINGRARELREEGDPRPDARVQKGLGAPPPRRRRSRRGNRAVSARARRAAAPAAGRSLSSSCHSPAPPEAPGDQILELRQVLARHPQAIGLGGIGVEDHHAPPGHSPHLTQAGRPVVQNGGRRIATAARSNRREGGSSTRPGRAPRARSPVVSGRSSRRTARRPAPRGRAARQAAPPPTLTTDRASPSARTIACAMRGSSRLESGVPAADRVVDHIHREEMMKAPMRMRRNFRRGTRLERRWPPQHSPSPYRFPVAFEGVPWTTWP